MTANDFTPEYIEQLREKRMSEQPATGGDAVAENPVKASREIRRKALGVALLCHLADTFGTECTRLYGEHIGEWLADTVDDPQLVEEVAQDLSDDLERKANALCKNQAVVTQLIRWGWDR